MGGGFAVARRAPRLPQPGRRHRTGRRAVETENHGKRKTLLEGVRARGPSSNWLEKTESRFKKTEKILTRSTAEKYIPVCVSVGKTRNPQVRKKHRLGTVCLSCGAAGEVRSEAGRLSTRPRTASGRRRF